MHWVAVKPPLNLLTWIALACATQKISALHSALVWLNDKSTVLTAEAIGVDFAADHQTTGSSNFRKSTTLVLILARYSIFKDYVAGLWLLSFSKALKNKYCTTLPHWSFSPKSSVPVRAAVWFKSPPWSQDSSFSAKRKDSIFVQC